jgi:hypothetical protein
MLEREKFEEAVAEPQPKESPAANENSPGEGRGQPAGRLEGYSLDLLSAILDP